MRFLAFDPLLFTLSGILASLQQSVGRFFFFAIAPMFYNLSIIVSIFVFKDNIGLVGLGIGAVTGAVIQLLIIASGMTGLSYKWSPKIYWHKKDFHLVLKILQPGQLTKVSTKLKLLSKPLRQRHWPREY